MLSSTALIVVTGKGGVGKTVVTAALGRGLAAAGRRVLLLESDPRENLHHLFDRPPSGGDVVTIDRRLALRNARPRAIVDAAVTRTLRLKALSRRVLASPIYEHFVEGAPGIKEMMLLGHALQVTEGEADHRADVVVLDAPASGHGLSLLAAPGLVADAIAGGPLGKTAARVADLVADADRCAVVVVTLAEEMPVQETIETIEAMRSRLGRGPELVVVNGIYPEVPRGVRGDAAALALWRTRRRINDGERARLAEAWVGPTAVLPLLAQPFGPPLLAALADALEPQLDLADAR